jgi:hypothetical protein
MKSSILWPAIALAALGSSAACASKDGSLIVGSEAERLERALRKVRFADRPAGTLAQLLVSFSPYAGMRVLHDNSLGVARSLLDKAGQKFAAPEIVADQGGRLVRFLP